jgi:polygalacturonase
VFIDKCTVVDGAKLNHLLFIKTNERRGGYVSNIYMSNIVAGKIDQGILGIETDVMYQWKDLVPTIERRLTPIKNIYLDVKFISRVLGQKELPVENVFLKNVHADLIQGNPSIHENLLHFESQN